MITVTEHVHGTCNEIVIDGCSIGALINHCRITDGLAEGIKFISFVDDDCKLMAYPGHGSWFIIESQHITAFDDWKVTLTVDVKMYD